MLTERGFRIFVLVSLFIILSYVSADQNRVFYYGLIGLVFIEQLFDLLYRRGKN